MKRILWVVAWLLEFCLIFQAATSCTAVESKNLTEEQSGWIYPDQEHYHSDYGMGDYNCLKIRKLTYEGHRFLIFQVDATERIGVVHDPNCPCATGEPLLTNKVEEDIEDRWKSLWD